MSRTKDGSGTGSVHVYEPGPHETATEAVITAVAEATDRSPLDMDPLVGVVDPDALNTVLDGNGSDPPHEFEPGTDPEDAPVAVVLDYANHRVLVTPDEVRVRPQG